MVTVSSIESAVRWEQTRIYFPSTKINTVVATSEQSDILGSVPWGSQFGVHFKRLPWVTWARLLLVTVFQEIDYCFENSNSACDLIMFIAADLA